MSTKTRIKKAPPTEAELQLKEDTLITQSKVMKDIKDLVVCELVNETETSRMQKFSVTDPQQFSKHTKYTVNGIYKENDNMVNFTVQRRYNEFYALV